MRVVNTEDGDADESPRLAAPQEWEDLNFNDLMSLEGEMHRHSEARRMQGHNYPKTFPEIIGARK
jgi:hypothetical protein